MEVNKQYLLNLYNKGELNKLHEEIYKLLKYFSSFSINDIKIRTTDEIKEVNDFVEVLLFLMLKDDFRFFDDNLFMRYLFWTTLFENLVYISDFKSTTLVLKKLLEKNEIPIEKVLFLFNLKVNNFDFSLIDIFIKNAPKYAYFWLYSLFLRGTFFHSKYGHRFKELQNYILKFEFYPYFNINNLYFSSTYIDPSTHLLIRKKIHEGIKKYVKFDDVKNNPSPSKNKIGIVSGTWYKDMAAYKCIGGYLESIKDEFDLYLININNKLEFNSNRNPRIFKGVYHVNFYRNMLNYTSIAENDFNMIIFTDIGLRSESIFLSSYKFAPIQVAMYGHPISTGYNCIDYFFVGEKSEDDISSCYKEKTITLPGTGMNSSIPPIKRPSVEEKINIIENKKTIDIFLSASSFKINNELVDVWKKIKDKLPYYTRFHILYGGVVAQELPILKDELYNIFGESMIQYVYKPYEEYLNIIKQCDIALGSFPYGEYNVVVDSLWVGTPFISLRGKCGFQNTGSAALMEIGLNELVVYSVDEYIEKTIELLKNKEKIKELSKKILNTPLENKLIYNKKSIEVFKKHITNLMQNS